MAKQGIDTVWCDSRYRGTDSALIMEKVLIDLGQCVKHLKEIHKYEKVILGGWSGGGSLSLFYQSQAEKPSITETPAGDPIDLLSQNFIPAGMKFCDKRSIGSPAGVSVMEGFSACD